MAAKETLANSHKRQGRAAPPPGQEGQIVHHLCSAMTALPGTPTETGATKDETGQGTQGSHRPDPGQLISQSKDLGSDL
jgi:hypothetical protein